MSFEDDLYKEIVLDNYKSKKHRGILNTANLKREGANPLCGDDITLYLEQEDGIVKKAQYEGHGCSICMASTNMLCKSFEGKKLEDVVKLIASFKGMLLENAEPDFPEELSDLEAMEGVKKYPVRIKCALLAWNTANELIKEEAGG